MYNIQKYRVPKNSQCLKGSDYSLHDRSNSTPGKLHRRAELTTDQSDDSLSVEAESKPQTLTSEFYFSITRDSSAADNMRQRLTWSVLTMSSSLGSCDVWTAGNGHRKSLRPQTNLLVGVYLAAALFLNNYKAFFFFFLKQTVLALQRTETSTRRSAGSFRYAAAIYRSHLVHARNAKASLG